MIINKDTPCPPDFNFIVTRDGVAGAIGLVESIDTDKDEIVRFIRNGDTFTKIVERWSDGFHGNWKRI